MKKIAGVLVATPVVAGFDVSISARFYGVHRGLSNTVIGVLVLSSMMLFMKKVGHRLIPRIADGMPKKRPDRCAS